MRPPLNPRYWPTWIGIAGMWLLARLPWRAQLGLGALLGQAMRWLLPSRRRIVRTNLRLCFPELNNDQRESLVREHFRDLGAGLLEANWCWFNKPEGVVEKTRIEGEKHFRQALATGRPVILLTAHFTSLEAVGPVLGTLGVVHGVYRKHRNAAMEWTVLRARRRYITDMIPREDMRATLRVLKRGGVIWYAPDQDYGRRNSVFAPFFGIPTATITATSRLARRTNALVVPMVMRRDGSSGYRIEFEAPLDGFPSGDDTADATRINQLLERWIRQTPAHYWWIHRRFKTRPRGDPPFYRKTHNAPPKNFTAKLPIRKDVERILIIKWSAMGDVIIATTVFEDIAKAFPNAELHLNTMAPWDTLLENDPRFKKVFTVPMRARRKPLREIWGWLMTVRAGRYDMVIDLQSNDRSRILIWLLRFVFANILIRMGDQRLAPYNVAPGPMPESSHAIDRLRATLQAGNIPTPTNRPVLHPQPHNIENAKRLRQDHELRDGRYAVFLPGSQAAGHLKRWGARRYVALGLALTDGELDRIAIVGGPDEMDECQAIADELGDRAVNLCGQTEILDIVPLCAGARVIVANDTGTAHVASATGRPLVAICGPTDPNRVKPVGDNVVALQAELFCRNCYRKTCSHHSCMLIVSPQQVLDAMPS